MEAEHYRVLEAATCSEFEQKYSSHEIDLIILDLTLPDGDGLALCHELRKSSRTPVIMLTARGDPSERITGLELGADDYVCKPFEPRELLARIRNILLRTSQPEIVNTTNARFIVFGYWTLDVPMRRVVNADGRAVILSGTEFRLLRLLIDNAGEVLSREQINELGGSHGDDSLDRAVDLQISRIRGKLDDVGPPYSIISTVRHKGYCFMAPIICVPRQRSIDRLAS